MKHWRFDPFQALLLVGVILVMPLVLFGLWYNSKTRTVSDVTTTKQLGILAIQSSRSAHSTIERSLGSGLRLDIDDIRHTAFFRYIRSPEVGRFLTPIAVMKDTDFTSVTLGVSDAVNKIGIIRDGTASIEGPFNSVLLKTGQEWNEIGIVDVSRLPDFGDGDSVEAFWDQVLTEIERQLMALLRTHYTEVSGAEPAADGNSGKPLGDERTP